MIKTLVFQSTDESSCIPPRASPFDPDLRRIWIVCAYGAATVTCIYSTITVVLELVILPHYPLLEKSTAPASENPVFAMDETNALGISDSSPFAKMSDEQFTVYITVVIWLTAVLTGIGLEILVWIRYLQPWTSDCNIRGNAEREFWWRVSQFVFPLVIMTALGLATTHNFVALPALVVGLWKFGFPETINHLYLGIYETNTSLLERAANLLNGIGSLMHHSAGALLIVSALNGLASPTRVILSPALVLIMQHWFALLFYSNKFLYSSLTLVWEFWFEWLLLSHLEALLSQHRVVGIGAFAMLFAHWLYLMAGAIGTLCTEKDENSNVHIRAISHFQGRCKEDQDSTDGNTTNDIGDTEQTPAKGTEADGPSILSISFAA